ncbi:MAG: hypothetical protein JW940_38865 [Polyangiaceae bacterium]|nr:hypothetical protein [Polyangiaceae bacterium]
MADSREDVSDAGAQVPRFESALSEGRDRFLAHVIEHALSVGRRSPEDFIRHFPPQRIMEGLADSPELRAQILVEATGLKQRIAARKPWDSAAQDLQIALTEGETSAAAILWGFHPDDRVRYLQRADLWAFVVEGDFWNVDPSSPQFAVAKAHVAFLLERALVDQLIAHRDIVEGITLRELSTRLPKVELATIIERALDAGHRNLPFTEAELLSAFPPSVLADYVPLPRVWKGVILPRIAERHGFVEAAAPLKSERPPGASDWGSSEQVASRGDEISEDDFASS